MRSPSSTWAHKALALLSATACLHAAASAQGPSQVNLAPPKDDPMPIPPEMEQYLYSETNGHPPDDPSREAADYVAYGRCYYFTNPENEHLGSDGGWYSYLKFGSNDYRRPFRLCKDHNDCSLGEAMRQHDMFYLEDYEGSHYAKGKNIVAGNVGGYIYPSFGSYTNYLRFQAYQGCDPRHKADCFVWLSLINQAHYNGLEFDNSKYVKLTANESTIPVNFHTVKCPGHTNNEANYEL
ncbi:hypothetical protein VUR80DRAFT_5460 [Thermomyces stellatus]